MISLDRLAAALEIDDHATDAPLLAEWRDAAIAFIQTQTRRYFGPVETFTDILVGKGVRRLWLTHRPFVGVGAAATTVQEYAYAGGTATDIVEGASSGFAVRVSDRAGHLVRLGASGVWTRGREYVVTYSRGYVEDGLPKDIEQLVIDLVGLRWHSFGDEVMKSETIGGYSYTRFEDGDLDSIDGAELTLNAWRRAVFA